MEYGLIGEKLGHSYSKEIHAEIGNYNYELKEIPKNELESFIKERNFKGINVTIPYKQDVIPLLDHVDEAALKIGAVNTVVNRDGKLYGYNTDFIGLKRLILSQKINLSGKKVLILGKGGTSRTAFAAAESLGAGKIIFVSRKASDELAEKGVSQRGNGSSEKSENLENSGLSYETAETVSYEAAASLHSDASVIINTTPVGMFPKTEGCPIDLAPFSKLEGVIDVIYNPLRTNLVLSAQKRNIPAKGGLFMLVQQAVAAAEFFFDTPLDPSRAEQIYKKIEFQKKNIVLIGMPGSGKSTIGKELSSALGRTFYDTDSVIEKNEGKAPSELITENGEKAFRDIESGVCKELSTLTGAVISTGGGSILREENVNFLKQNGELFFLDRKFEKIRPTKDRPLSNSVDKLKEVFRTRYPIYCASADFHINCRENKKQTTSTIIKLAGGKNEN